MYLYSFLYRVTCIYKNVSNRIKHYVYEPFMKLRNEANNRYAIDYAFVVNNFGDKKVLYNLGYLTTLMNLFYMCCIFGQNTWIEYYRDQRCVFDIESDNKDDLIYVRLVNGKEYLVRGEFSSDDDSLFCKEDHPKKNKYLCVILGNHNITRIYKRFVSSLCMPKLKVSVMDIALLCMHLEPSIKPDLIGDQMIASNVCLTVVDDETFEETVYKNHDIVLFT